MQDAISQRFVDIALRLVYAGTPAFAVPPLAALRAAGHTVVAVYTQPDRPAGRGRRESASAVKQYAIAHGLAVHQPLTLRGEAESLAALGADALIVVAYGLILPASILSLAPAGCINVHASLLPRWRGAAPIARAIAAGDVETGISIMQMEAGLDTGPVLAQARIPITDTDTAASLHDRLAVLGADLLVATLADLEQGRVRPQPQDSTRACYAPKLTKQEAVLDWRQSARVLHWTIRAFNPAPVATTSWRGETLRLWDVGPLDAHARADEPPGTVIGADRGGIRVATGDGVLTLTRLQAPGAKAVGAAEFVNGRRLRAGDRFGT